MSYFNSITAKFEPANMSAFGTLETAELAPVFQGDWVYGINTQLWNTPVVSGTGATVDTNASRLRIQSGTDSAGYAYITSKKLIRYRAGQGVVARFTPIYTTGVANNTQLWGVGTIASNVPSDGYFIGYVGTQMSIVRYRAGTPEVIARSAWNGDKVDGTAGTAFNWNPALGTPAMIKYPYLGYGDIEFFLQNPSTGRWVLIHVIRYANTTATTQIANPCLQFIGFTQNTGNTTNQIMYSGSVGCFISGTRNFVSNPKWAMDSNKSAITTETNLLTLKNATTYNGATNRGMIRLNSISGGITTNSIAIVKLKLNATLGGSPSYTTINGTSADQGVTITAGNSITSYDIAGTTVTGGTYIYNFSIGQTGSLFIDLTQYELYVSPSETLTVSATGTLSSNVGISLNWSEDI